MIADKTSEAATKSDFDAGCMAYLRQMAALMTCNCRRAVEPCMGKPVKQGQCQDCADGCRTLRVVRVDAEDEISHHAPPPRTEAEMTQKTDAVRAARKATIDRAITYLTTTDRDTILATLAKTRFGDHLKTSPEQLIRDLRDADHNEVGPFFARWKAAQNVLLAAGLPIA